MRMSGASVDKATIAKEVQAVLDMPGWKHIEDAISKNIERNSSIYGLDKLAKDDDNKLIEEVKSRLYKHTLYKGVLNIIKQLAQGA